MRALTADKKLRIAALGILDESMWDGPRRVFGANGVSLMMVMTRHAEQVGYRRPSKEQDCETLANTFKRNAL